MSKETDRHPFVSNPYAPAQCKFCGGGQRASRHLSDDADQHGRRIPFETPPTDQQILTLEQIGEIEARAGKASIAPWEQRYIGSKGYTVWATAITRTGSMQVAAFGHAEGFDQDNAEFTAHARKDVPALCQTVRAHETNLKAYRELVEAFKAKLSEVEKERDDLKVWLKQTQDERDTARMVVTDLTIQKQRLGQELRELKGAGMP